jgi:hypothetical protein
MNSTGRNQLKGVHKIPFQIGNPLFNMKGFWSLCFPLFDTTSFSRYSCPTNPLDQQGIAGPGKNFILKNFLKKPSELQG